MDIKVWSILVISLQTIFKLANAVTEQDTVLVNLLSDKHAKDVRLPKYAEPLDYFVKIYPIGNEDLNFSGYVRLRLLLLRETQIIALNMANLDLDFESLRVSVFEEDGERIIGVTDYRFYPEKEIITFTLEVPLQENKLIQFICSYSGLLVSDSYGLNRYLYEDDNGHEKTFIVTYLQPAGARRVFPCLDEPQYKARFTIHVAHPQGTSAKSNMQVNNTVPIVGSKFFWSEFEESLPMSPYLVAILVSDFSTHTTIIPQITKVWSRPSILSKTSYASSLAPKVLKYYEKYFGVVYPLSKLDIVTLPKYPVPGMENFGLILTKEDSLTTNQEFKRKDWVSTVTAHEIAHQWIGNLVTPVWWSQYWLSEGFASYFAARALEKVEPRLEAMNHLVVENIRLMMIQDGRPGDGMVLQVQKFDPLYSHGKNVHIYYKGAAVLRMFNSIFGEFVFAKGIKKYFKKYRFRSVTEKDFYDIFTTEDFASFKDFLPASLEKIMHGWTTQMSYPLLTVNKLPNGTISLRQEMFIEKESVSKSDLSNDVHITSTWWIPISYYTSKDTDFSTLPKTWLPPSPKPLILNETILPNSWIVFNSQQASYMRVNYDSELWNSVSDQLVKDHSKIHILNRAQLFEDAFHLFKSGYTKMDHFLNLMRYLSNERNFIPFHSAMRAFKEIEITMRGNSHYNLLKSFLASIIEPIIKDKFGKTYTEEKRFQVAMSWACKIQNQNCTRFAKILFREWEIKDDLRIYPELAKMSLMCSAVESGSDEEFNVVFKRGFDPSSRQEKKELLQKVLPCSQNKTGIESFLDFILNGNHSLQYEDVSNLFNYLARSTRWNSLTWNFINNHYFEIKKRYDFTPVPFVATPTDNEQLLKVLKKMDPEIMPLLAPFIEESKAFAASGARIISQVTEWLVKMAPFEVPK